MALRFANCRNKLTPRGLIPVSCLGKLTTSTPHWGAGIGGSMLRKLHIEVTSTPNSECRVFLPKLVPLSTFWPSDPLCFTTPLESKGKSAIAELLLEIPGVQKILITPPASISVTKSSDASWPDMQSAVIRTLSKALGRGVRLWEETEADTSDLENATRLHRQSHQATAASAPIVEDDDPDDYVTLEQCLEDVLQTRVAPALQRDGGHVSLHKFDAETGTLWIRLWGACDGCPSADQTVQSHIQALITYFFDEVKQVRVFEPSTDKSQLLNDDCVT